MPTTTSRPNRVLLFGAAGALSVLALTGCSSSGTDTASSPTPSASASSAFCADAAATKASLQTLVSTDLLADGTSTLQDRFATFKSDADTLVTSAQSEFSAQATALKTSVAVLQTTIDALTSQPSLSDVAAIKPALQAISTSAQALIDAVDSACPQ